ncbi:hypothetical protein [Shinella kummerowiae]|uniref:hypothetical protein n=1 Tax=Shinella kummerowiae TaxID=417745 RepID=UPI0021B61046|nr:hypothetical protein [Shinella kummerowiae]MCT7665478.1 hypothetical protein [Shinella kummerowiae]
MLPLDDPRWKDLQHAYGEAADIPALLHLLAQSSGPKADYQEEPWFGLWSRLCHQGDVYTASYAAVPHIVRIAADAKGPIDTSFFLLPTSIEIARKTGRGPRVPHAYDEAYHRAVGLLPENAFLHRHQAWDRSMLLSIAAAQAVAKGHVDLAESLLDMADEHE